MGDRDRARGALLGLAVGDALGTTLEFTQGSKAPPFPRLADGPHTRVIGGGPFDVVAGQVTDDTQMATCLATSLKERGKFDLEDVARRYLQWQPHAFDIGTLTSKSLSRIRNQGVVESAGREVWIESGRESAGNGSLMRTAPIGVALADNAGARRAASLADSAITHFDPRCQLACAAFNAAISFAITSPTTRPVVDVRGAAVSELAGAAAQLTGMHQELAGEITTAQRALADDLQHAGWPDPELYGPELHLLKGQGFVRVAFRLAFWELLHAPNYQAALIDVVNRGGDSDTNGAITGALFGAVYGEEAIPVEWREVTLSALRDVGGVFGDLYHPKRLLEMIA